MAPQQTPAPLTGRAYYGFVLYVSAWTCIFCYLTWAIVPHEYLHVIGISYLPHRFWAIALPTIIVTGVVLFITLIYPGINLLLAVAPDDMRTLYDSHTIRRESYEEPHNCSMDSCSDNISPDLATSVKKQTCRKFASKSVDESEAMDNSSVPPVYDLDISEVCKILYGRQN
ncbi:hypothetical protein HAZT_HAZT009176 [Hyalella azteca]|uniref:Phosphatidylinositol N-acetylglucosaminyltransferase subunit P-like n=1 Tax=Hyalella azteca TaxID=294128 RepID=A0A6A0GY96_HYAAZ|nr:phosphatidylinositol N-acetylglucosaminyltransferase subunit P-like [Hyalella azteca]XP_018014040.1 phosphatidylinositol N-acetylglucosaminyltransferase subunit P-like [Hyalella azteca]KAA0192786.1 hypothetical protein HAZT_HAZT009176 [Hyalella azteca]